MTHPPAPPSKLHAVSNDEGGTSAVCGYCQAQDYSKSKNHGNPKPSPENRPFSQKNWRWISQRWTQAADLCGDASLLRLLPKKTRGSAININISIFWCQSDPKWSTVDPPAIPFRENASILWDILGCSPASGPELARPEEEPENQIPGDFHRPGREPPLWTIVGHAKGMVKYDEMDITDLGITNI